MSDWYARGLDWALADSLTHPTTDEWVADDIARAFAAGAAAARRQALEEAAQWYMRKHGGQPGTVGHAWAEIEVRELRSLIDKDAT